MAAKSFPLRFELSRVGYDPFIDFLKGMCIVLIVLNHCIPMDLRSLIGFPIWGSPAVPIFLIIQVFHFYKKGLNAVKLNYRKVWRRIVKPFLIVELFILLVLLCSFWSSNDHAVPSVKEGVYMLTGGPGSYYPWIYLQFAILLPVFRSIFKYKNAYSILFIFILLSQLVEVLCVVCLIPEWFYRLIFFRYVFLIYLGYILASKGYVLTMPIVLLSIISLVITIVFVYAPIESIPFCYHVEAWSTCHWICYIYMAFFMMTFLYVVYSRIPNHPFTILVKKMGVYSYEIYLIQLLFFTLISQI